MRPRAKSRSGFAILMVVLVLVGLVVIGAPFAISMRQEERASMNFAARIRARLSALEALNRAKAHLELSHEYYERMGDAQTIYNTPTFDAPGEFRVSVAEAGGTTRRTVLIGATAEDEQGKINLASASKALLTNLFLAVLGEELDPNNPGATRSEAMAQAIVAWRANHKFTSLAQLHQAIPDLTETEFQLITPFLTVWSSTMVGQVSSTMARLHPVNINTCSVEVLRALLRGIRLREPDVAEDERHKGVGFDQYVETDEEGNTTGTWTDDLDELVRRLRVVCRLGSDVEPSSTTLVVESSNPMVDTTQFLPVPKTSPTGSDEVEGFWVAIDGDAVRYWKKEGQTLHISQDPAWQPAAAVNRARSRDEGVEVRLVLADIEHDLAGILDRLVEEKKLTPKSRAAILANALNPLNSEVLDTSTTTAPFCLRSYDIYSIEASGVVNAPDGTELAHYTMREVVQLAPPVPLEIRLDTQADFQRSLTAGLSHHVATWPNNTQAADIAPAANEPPEDSDLERHGRVGLEPVEFSPSDPITFAARFTARFKGPLKDDILRGDTDGHTETVWPDPDPKLTTVQVEPGEGCDSGPEGVHVGEVQKGSENETRTLAYPGRADAQDSEGNPIPRDNIPHNDDFVVQPMVAEMWVKFDGEDKFDYGKDHFLFDFGERTFSNRIALYYYSRGSDQGDLVLHVCDSTNQLIAAQVRCRITKDRTQPPGVPFDQWFHFEPERWYHVVAVVKGIHYGEMALFIDGRSVGRYVPSARVSGGVGPADLTIPCSGTDGDGGDDAFRLQPWPPAGVAILGGEIVEYSGTSGGLQIAVPEHRGSRNTQARAHPDGTRIEIYGYTDYISKAHDDVEQPLDYMLRGPEEPLLAGDLPATYEQVTVDDGDETNPDGVPAPTTFTHDGTTEYLDGYSDSYQAADVGAENTIPEDGWLPVGASSKWIVNPAAGETLQDDEERFNEVLQSEDGPTLASLLVWTAQRPTVADRQIEEADGIGFFVVEKNPDDEDTGEIIKFSKAGVVLVWRYHPEDAADPEIPDEQKRKIAWYIAYVAGFGGEGDFSGHRACFDTEEKPIVEGAKIRLDCIKVSDNQKLARGHRGPETIEHRIAGTDQTVTETRDRNGRGIFQLVFRDPQGHADTTKPFEWLQYTFPRYRYPPVPEGEQDEEAQLLGTKWLVGISRAVAGTGDADHNPVAFPAAQAKIMPVFICSGYLRTMDKDVELVKGGHDEVTLTDNTGQRESHWVHHASGHFFAFRESVTGLFNYAARPRLLKFPSSMPIRPDTLFYIGSDSVCRNGDTSVEVHDDPDATTEPERPANATFDEVKIYSARYRVARLWDAKKTSDGAPDPAKDARNIAPVEPSWDPPFYIRIGNLESIVPKDAPTPFRFLSNGHVDSWPLEGYLKIDDEVMYYRVIYRRPGGRMSAPIKFIRPTDSDGNPITGGLITVLTPTDDTLYIDLDEEEGKNFPDKGYLTISNSWANKDYWDRVAYIMATYGVTWDQIQQDLQQGGEVVDESGRPIIASHYVNSQERIFFDGKTWNSAKECWELHLTHRGILDSEAKEVKFWDPESSNWYLGGGSPTNARVYVISVELMILERGCLGTQRDRHAIGARIMPLEHIKTAITPMPMVRVRRGPDGKLILEDGKIKVYPEDDPEWQADDPRCELAIVLEQHDNFPAEGYVQIGNEIIGYCQDRNGSSPIWTARVPIAKDGSGQWVYKNLPVLTGIGHFRQRYGTARETYLEPGDAAVVATVDPFEEEPLYYQFANDFQSAGQPYYRRIVRIRQVRYHDRYPTLAGAYTPHPADGAAGYYEFSYHLPGALWTQVQWREMKWDPETGTLTNATSKQLDEDDPWDVHVMVQIDNAPAWDDTTPDPANSNKPVATPVHWQKEFPFRPDLYDDNPASHRPRKPVIYLFDDPTADNYINPLGPNERGQFGDTIRVRVYFKFRDYDDDLFPAPNYHLAWRTPWVDWLTVKYRAPSRVFEHRELPY